MTWKQALGGLMMLAAAMLTIESSPVSGADSDSAKKRIVVNLDRQKLFAYEGDKLFHECHCVTGRAGHETTPGTFKIFLKDKEYVSKKYKTPMPFAMFFTKDRKAIHGTTLAVPRSFAKYLGADEAGSHGCIGVTPEDAEKLFKWADVGTAIEIVER